MNRFEVTENIEAVLVNEILIPSVVKWNRLEGRPRTQDFSQALRSEVADPLWMLTRQWQTGEFEADDAGSPVIAQLTYVTDPLTHLRIADGTTVELDDDLPLEAMVERHPIPRTVGGQPVSLDLRLVAGRHWVKMLDAVGLPSTIVADFRTAYPVAKPDPADPDDAPITAHARSWQWHEAVAGLAVDGLALIDHLRADPAVNLASDGIGLIEPDKSTVDDLGPKLVAWFEWLYSQPDAELGTAWTPPHLEYSVECAAPTSANGRVLIADEYHGGHLDWYSFDESPAPGFGQSTAPTADRRVVRRFFPTGVQFDGMPNTRWWTFEESATNFGDLAPDTTDLSKLLLAEFGLLYANDWFLAPIELPIGSVCTVDGLAVSNVFGERFWIEPSSTAVDDSWRSWGMFTLSQRAPDRPSATHRPGGPNPGLLLPPSTPRILQGRPVEVVHMVRDEVSNMVWGVEATIQLPDGSPRRGREAAAELHRWHQEAADAANGGGGGDPADRPNDADVRYRLMNSIAGNWIPFIGVHLDGDNREIQLQRASMPLLLRGESGTGDPPSKIRPRTTLLRPGPDTEVPEPYFVYEEEVSRAGEMITSAWQRTRWLDGEVVVWRGSQRSAGRGGVSSGLGYDEVVPVVDRRR